MVSGDRGVSVTRPAALPGWCTTKHNTFSGFVRLRRFFFGGEFGLSQARLPPRMWPDHNGQLLCSLWLPPRNKGDTADGSPMGRTQRLRRGRRWRDIQS